jgi:hypothetical protein
LKLEVQPNQAEIIKPTQTTASQEKDEETSSTKNLDSSKIILQTSSPDMTRITYNNISKPLQKEKPQTKLKKQNPYIYRPYQIAIDKKHMEDFVSTCLETKDFIDSLPLLTLVPYKSISHLVGYFFFDKYARRYDFTHEKIKLRIKSRNQIDNLCRLRELREANKLWHKLSDDEKMF